MKHLTERITIMNVKIIKGYTFVIISAIIFGCMPLGAKYIYTEGVNSLSLVFLRNCLALPVLGLLAGKQESSLHIEKIDLLKISSLAVMGGCATPILLYSSYHYLASGTATVFHFIYPVLVVLGSILILREKGSKPVFLCVILCTVGIILFYNPQSGIHPGGSLLAIASGATYAAYIMLLSRFKNDKISGFKLSFYMSAVGSVILFIVCMISRQLTLPVTFTGWTISIVFSLILSVGAVVLFQQGTRYIGGQRAAILSTLEPITSVLVGALVFQETINARTVLGTALVIIASILIAVFDSGSAK